MTSIVAHASPLSRPLGDPPWGGSVRVTDDEKDALQDYPATAVASTGDVYAVWADYRDYVEVAVVYFARSTDGGQTWSANILITTGLTVNGESGAPAVAAAGPYNVHVVWGSSPVGYPHVYYSRSGDSGASWSAPQRLDGGDPMNNAVEPDVASDGANLVYAVWSQYSSLNLARSGDGGATWPVTPTQILTSAYMVRRPALAVDAGGALHLAWEEHISQVADESVICYARSADRGATWTPRQCFGTPDARNLQTRPDIAVSPLDGRIHIVWEQDTGKTTEIYHTTADNSGDKWNTPQRISGGWGGATWPAVAVTASGGVYAVWQQEGALPEIYYARSADGGQIWNTPGRVNDAPRSAAQHPAIAAGQTPHVLWRGQNLQQAVDIYAAALTSPRLATIPLSQDTVTLDGQCGARTEYAGAAAFPFSDFGMTSTVYLQHDGAYLYVCMDAHHGFYDQDRAAVVYLDTDGARETLAEADDYALKVNFIEGTMGQQSSFYGSGNPASPYSPTRALVGWTGVATYTGVVGQAGGDVAEYRIPITLTGGLCGAPFGLAVYHQGYQSVYFTPFGWPRNQFYNEPHTWQLAYYAGEPCPEPTELPIFGLLPPDVTPDDALGLAGRLDGITGTEVISGDTHAGTSRFLVVDEGHGTQFEMFGASGGFLASNPARAFGEGEPMDPDAGDPARLACLFLLQNGLFTAQTPAYAQNCDNPAALGYEVISIKRASTTPQLSAAQVEAETIGVVVKTPVGVALPTFEVPTPVHAPGAPRFNPQPEPPGYPVPFDGPGGHLSLLFAGGEFSLDSSTPGLGAIAAPAFGRRLYEIDRFRAISRAEAEQRALDHVRRAMPDAEAIQLGEGELVYYLGDPAVPQSVVLPMWAFHNISVTIGGETAAARGFYVPAVDGTVPVVTITSPPEGALFHSGDVVTVTALIVGGTPPYTYTLSRDDGSVLREGVTTGTLQLPSVLLTATLRAGGVTSLTLRLDVADQYGVSGWDTVSLQPILYHIYLPLVLRNADGGGTPMAMLRPFVLRAPQAVNYDVGIEYISDYLPLGPGGKDIPMTVPDAIGFYNQLRWYGWGHAFKYGETNAWERDWRDCSLGGSDCTYGVEQAEFAYFTGHGSPARIYFSSNVNSQNFWGGNARFQNVRWAGFSSCQTLRASTIDQWFGAFQGAHMLLGFNSNMADISFGGPLGYNMREHCILWWCSQLTIREAWVKTAFDMNAGKPAYIYAVGTNGVNPVNNKLPDGDDPLMGRPYPVASWHWVWWE